MKKLLSILLLITISARADVGRVWVDSTPTATLLAHELGHGQYKFKHTFSEIPELAEGSTTPKNVEDYAPGSYLYKYQWDQIHFPLQDEFVCLDSDKEGQRAAGIVVACGVEDMPEKEMFSGFKYFKVSSKNNTKWIKLTSDVKPHEFYVYKNELYLLSFKDNAGNIYSDNNTTETITNQIFINESYKADEYYVQVAALANPNSNYKNQFIEKKENGFYKYLLKLNTLEEAIQKSKAIQQDYNGAFVVAYSKGSRVKIPELKFDILEESNPAVLEFNKNNKTNFTIHSTTGFKGSNEIEFYYNDRIYKLKKCILLLPDIQIVKEKGKASSLSIFVSGYVPDIEIILNDIQGKYQTLEQRINSQPEYWAGIDEQFMTRIGNTNCLYRDGTEDISTSGHSDFSNFQNNNFKVLKDVDNILNFSEAQLDDLSDDIDKFDRKYYKAISSALRCNVLSNTIIGMIDGKLKEKEVNLYNEMRFGVSALKTVKEFKDYIQSMIKTPSLKNNIQSKIKPLIDNNINAMTNSDNEYIRRYAKLMSIIVKVDYLKRKIMENKNLPCVHNTYINDNGYKVRKDKGLKDGEAIAKDILSGKINLNKDTGVVDIVAHSMGYAHAMGIVEALQAKKIKVGRIYAIAPENPGSMHSKVPNGIEEFWQYGSDETIKIENQDGVAPQKAIDGLSEKSDKTKFGRAFIPKDGSVPVGWFLSHSLANYMWIFEKKEGDIGYVKQRK